MEKFQELREIAKKKISIADHILTQTYPMLQDTKLLLNVLENIFLSMTNSMGAILHYERMFKQIPPFQDTFDSKYNMFMNRIIDRYQIQKSYLDRIKEIKDIIIQHKKSPVEFRRKDKFVICDEDYQMKSVSVDEIKKMIIDAKRFANIAEQITAKNEEIFRVRKDD